MTETRNAIFPTIEKNITIAQQKQKQQYLKRTGGAKFTFKNGDTVLWRNMLQKTSKGHKMEDQWMGPYTTEEVDLEKGTCKLRAKSGTLLQRKLTSKISNCIESSPHHKHLKMMQYNNLPHQQLNRVAKLYKEPFHQQVRRVEQL